MKKLIILLAMFVPFTLNAQRVYTLDSMSVPIGDDTTWTQKFFTGHPWSIQFNCSEFDSTAVGSAADLYVYSSNDADSSLYNLVWVDRNLDGSNDNPWELTDSTLTVWGESFPFVDIVYKLEKDSVSSGLKLYYWVVKQ